MRLRNVVWISAVVLAASALAGVGAPMFTHAASGDTQAATLSVTGTGSVTTEPDTATTSFGVTTQAQNARDAIARGSEEMRKVIAALKRAGVRDKDLQTQFVSVDPRYDDQGQQILGYAASNSVSAVVRDLRDVGDVIDAGIAAGANNVSGPSLSRDDKDKLYRDALESAVVDARAKATTLAHAAGASLGAIRSITESPQQATPFPYATESLAAKDAAGPPIEAGTAEISATVQIVFTLDG